MLCSRFSDLVVLGFLNDTQSLVGDLGRAETLLASPGLGLLVGHVAPMLMRNHVSLAENLSAKATTTV